MSVRHGLAAALLAGLAATALPARASGLQVSPVSLQLKATQDAEGLWLSNTGHDLLHAQVRVYQWSQSGATDRLAPSQGLAISPPMLEIKPGERQLVRVIRVGGPPAGAEAAYRLAIDELPLDLQGKHGLQFVLHYSVPVFLEPPGAAPVSPQLHWQMRQQGDRVVLEVANGGNGHAQLSALSFIGHAGRRIDIDDGLLGYVLPGATMHWTLKQPASDFAAGGALEARINGAQVTQIISLARRAH